MLPVNTDDEYKTPGQLLTALLADRGWTQRILAIVLGQDETGINKIVADKRPISAELALSLEEVFSVPAERFLALQQRFELAKARLVVRPDPNRATRAHLFGGLPVSDMIKRGWLDVQDVPNRTHMGALHESHREVFVFFLVWKKVFADV